MSINTENVHLTPYLAKHKIVNRVSLEEILQDFKSLEDLASANEELMNETTEEPENKVLKSEYKMYLQIQDFRRPKMQESHSSGSKYRKLNKSYSLQEMKEMGLEVKSPRRGSLHQKFDHHAVILSEFIL